MKKYQSDGIDINKPRIYTRNSKKYDTIYMPRKLNQVLTQEKLINFALGEKKPLENIKIQRSKINNERFQGDPSKIPEEIKK